MNMNGCGLLRWWHYICVASEFTHCYFPEWFIPVFPPYNCPLPGERRVFSTLSLLRLLAVTDGTLGTGSFMTLWTLCAFDWSSAVTNEADSSGFVQSDSGDTPLNVTPVIGTERTEKRCRLECCLGFFFFFGQTWYFEYCIWESILSHLFV